MMPQPAGGAPRPRIMRLPPWPGLRVHRQGGEIACIDREVIGPDEPTDLRCPGCRADATVLIGDGETAGVIAFCADHQPGCPRLARMLRDAEGNR